MPERRPPTGRGGGSLSPPQVLVLALGSLSLLGAALLSLPQAAATGQSVGVLDALFTAVSAVCVTGLVTLDTATAWSPFGHYVILGLMQLGGFGIMTGSTLLFLLVGKRITLRERLIMQQQLGKPDLSGVVRLTREIIFFTLVIELAGALILTARFLWQYPAGEAVKLGVFHAVSAFNNAGFDLFGASLQGYVDDWVVVTTVAALVVLGGIGFAVMDDVLRTRRWEKLTLHSKVVLAFTAALVLVGWLLTMLLEWSHEGTLAGHTIHGKVLGSLHLSVSARTAGFSVMPTELLHPSLLAVLMVLMFIGGASGSTAGGIKVSTFGTIFLELRAIVTGRNDVEVWGRRLPRESTEKAFAVALIFLGLLVAVATVLLFTENADTMVILFETVSAVGTVGLSMGLTPELSPVGKLVITIAMFAGRVGPLTLAIAIAQRRRVQAAIHYPEERIMIG